MFFLYDSPMKLFGTAINCMDGRVQPAIHQYIKEKYNVDYVDTITLAGPVKIIATRITGSLIRDLKFRVAISVDVHKSDIIALVGHTDCAGIHEPDDLQKKHLIQSVKKVKQWYPQVKVIGLWLDDDFHIVQEIT